MESLGKDYTPADSSLPPSASSGEYAVPDVIITHRLRDRELLRKRRAEALEKDSTQWIMRMPKNQQRRRGKRAKRGRGRKQQVKAILEPETTTDPQPGPQQEAEPVHSESALPEPAYSESALPEPAYQEKLPVLKIQKLGGGMQAVAVGGVPAVKSSDPAGEEEVVRPAEAEKLEDLSTSLENDRQDD